MRQGTLPTSLGQLVHSYDKPPEILILPWRLGLALICLWITNVKHFHYTGHGIETLKQGPAVLTSSEALTGALLHHQLQAVEA